MNIVMLSNTYTPHVGGVARSVEAFARQFRELGHKVLIVAPEFDNQPDREINVVRIPALQHFNGSDFSVALPVSGLLTDKLNEFQPDIVHAHHPFLLGMTALRIARYRRLPLAFTHHTLYEQYTHYVPGNSPALKRFAIDLATRYANLADVVFAPSESIASLLVDRGVRSAIRTLPTGVDVARFKSGNGVLFRQQQGIPNHAFVVGHLGRLAPEKNLTFLAKSVIKFIHTGFLSPPTTTDARTKPNKNIHFLLVGTGPSEKMIHKRFEQAGIQDHLHVAGVLSSQQLADAYHAMDVFAFSSLSETQGMVLTEAMAAGTPVVALDAPGTREVVTDSVNGRLLEGKDPTDFSTALQWISEQPTRNKAALAQAARNTADHFSMANTAVTAISYYQDLLNKKIVSHHEEDKLWSHLLDLIKVEWEIVEGVASAAGNSLRPDHS